MPGTLYVVATPIGNLEDLSVRAARVLGEVDLIAAENTRTAQRLLRHAGLRTRCVPYNDRNKGRTTKPIMAALLAGESVALMSDAGTPGLSDPGQDLVAAAVEAGARVTPVPGPSAATALLSVAGVRTRTLRLLGFLPRRSGERRALLESVGAGGEPALAFESPHRMEASLAALADVLPEARLVVGRELTKVNEEVWRGTPAEAAAHFESPRGEFTLLIVPEKREEKVWDDAAVRAALAVERALGRRWGEAAAVVASRSGRQRSEVYRLRGETGKAASRARRE